MVRRIDDFAPNLSFFFSNGMDPEYTVIGRVARRIWARAMRERYGAELSLGFVEGEELMVFSGDEGRSRRNLDMLSMASHLAGKHEWIEKLPSEDFVARIRIHDFAAHPDRLDEVISQIAMGRSILEG